MTTITLNLLAEEQLALERRARDPFKVVLAIGVLLSASVAGLGAYMASLAARAESSVKQVEGRLASLQDSEIAEQEVRYRYTEGLSQDILTLNHTRRNMAAHLAAVKDVIPASVRLSSLRFVVALETAPLAPPPPGGDDGAAKPKKRPRPAPTVERLALRLEGVAFGARPELEVDEFLNHLRNDEAFGPQLAEVQLLSVARLSPAVGAAGGAPLAAAFVIECRYKE